MALVGLVIFQRAVCDVMALNGESCAFTVALQPVDAATIYSNLWCRSHSQFAHNSFFFLFFFSSSFFAHNRWTMGNDQWSYKGWIPFTIFISQKCYVHTVYQVYIHTVCVYGCVCVSFCWLNVKNCMCYHMKVSSASASAFFLLILLANQIKYFLDLACTLWKSGLFGRSWALLSCY